jgi:hypothetical protein
VPRLAVIVCIVGLLGSLVAALTAAAQSGDKLDLAVVGVDARIGGDNVRGAGVVIDADAGLVLTSARSVWGATSLRLTTGVGELYGRIVARAPCTGIALVEAQPRIPGLVALEGGTGSSGTPFARGAGGELMHLKRSGAPVVDSNDRITGIVDGTDVVPWSEIDERLGELQPDERRIYVGWRDEYACAPKLHALTKQAHPRFREIDAVLNAPLPASRVPGTEELDR